MTKNKKSNFSNKNKSINNIARMMQHKNKNGFYYGINQTSHSIIVYDRTTVANDNELILGKSGGGLSFTTKQKILEAHLRTNNKQK